jgi:hypothetical protein
MLDENYKSQVFVPELALIFDESIREFTRLCIVSAPDYFFLDCPASSSGKYHPIDELGADGTVIHTKKVFTVAYDMCVALECQGSRDEILAACLIHDLRKQGLTRSGHTVKEHPALAVNLIDDIQSATQILSEKSHKIIRNAVGFHFGLWSYADWKKPLSDYNREELCVYLSDFIASKRPVSVNYKK